jgi:hypothetical protein
MTLNSFCAMRIANICLDALQDLAFLLHVTATPLQDKPFPLLAVLLPLGLQDPCVTQRQLLTTASCFTFQNTAHKTLSAWVVARKQGLMLCVQHSRVIKADGRHIKVHPPPGLHLDHVPHLVVEGSVLV